MNKDVEDLTNLVGEKQTQIDNLNKNIEDLSKTGGEKDKTISSLNSQINQKNQEISNLNSQISQKNQTINSLNEQIRNLSNVVGEIKRTEFRVTTSSSLRDEHVTVSVIPYTSNYKSLTKENFAISSSSIYAMSSAKNAFTRRKR